MTPKTERLKSYDNEFKEYMVFIKTNIPESLFIKDNYNKSLFLSVNNAFKLSDILTDFEFVTSKSNYYNLLVEYKNFFARILSAISLNDKFLIDNLLRLLTEKLYRILTGYVHSARGERRIRTDTREKMSRDLTSKLDPFNKNSLDTLYNDLSEAIHHKVSTPSDLYDIRKIFVTPLYFSEEIVRLTDQLTDIFVDELFIKVCLNKMELCGTNFSMKIENNILPKYVQKIRSALNI